MLVTYNTCCYQTVLLVLHCLFRHKLIVRQQQHTLFAVVLVFTQLCQHSFMTNRTISNEKRLVVVCLWFQFLISR